MARATTAFLPLPPPPPGHALSSTPPAGAAGVAGVDTLLTPELASLSIAHEMLAAVSLRVSSMLTTATRASETQVVAEMRKLEAGLSALAAKAGRVEALLSQRSGAGSALASPDRQQDVLSTLLVEVEQRWDAEIKSVKRELHQTILAHNHNADLMADHKAAIDRIRSDLETYSLSSGIPGVVTEQECREHLDRLRETLENSQAMEQDIDTLLRRGEALFQRLGQLGLPAPLPTAPAGLPGGQPTLPACPGLQHLPGLPSSMTNGIPSAQPTGSLPAGALVTGTLSPSLHATVPGALPAGLAGGLLAVLPSLPPTVPGGSSTGLTVGLPTGLSTGLAGSLTSNLAASLPAGLAGALQGALPGGLHASLPAGLPVGLAGMPAVPLHSPGYSFGHTYHLQGLANMAV